MSFSTYPKYKESGLQWLGEVPENWAVGSLKNMARICNGRDYKEVESPDGNYPVIGSGGQFSNATDYLYEGESVLLGRKGTIDKPLYVNGRFWTVDTMFFTEISTSTSAKFFYYNALTIPFSFYSTSTALPSMTQGDLLNHPCAIPTLKEQTQIARFLDHETARIDALIEEQQRLIELLKEKRQAVISHAVTKGLDPTVPMKDSGVEWLGEVPAHWVMTTVKRYCDVRDGTHSTPDYVTPSESSFPLVTSKDISTGRLSLIETNHISKYDHFEISKRSEVSKGDVLMPMIGTVGGAVVVNTDDQFSIKNIALFKKGNYSSKWLNYLLDSDLSLFQFELNMSGGVQNFVALGTLRNLVFPTPKKNEQENIVEFLDSNLKKFSQLISEAEKTVEFILERRSALISAAVTGKIDVRGWQPPASAATAEQQRQEAV